jgi:hypothetical protein
MRAISLDAFVRNQAGQRDWGNAIMSPQTSEMMGYEQENLLKKYTTCSNTPEITAYALAAHHTDPRGARMFLEQAQQLGEDEMEEVAA